MSLMGSKKDDPTFRSWDHQHVQDVLVGEAFGKEMGLGHYKILATVPGDAVAGTVDHNTCKMKNGGLLLTGEAPRAVRKIGMELLRYTDLNATVLGPSRIGGVRHHRLGIGRSHGMRMCKIALGQGLGGVRCALFREFLIRRELLLQCTLDRPVVGMACQRRF